MKASSINSFKELYLDFEDYSGILPEEINFSKAADYKTRQSIEASKLPSARGLTISLLNYIIYG
jgi:hypothetical protein